MQSTSIFRGTEVFGQTEIIIILTTVSIAVSDCLNSAAHDHHQMLGCQIFTLATLAFNPCQAGGRSIIWG